MRHFSHEKDINYSVKKIRRSRRSRQVLSKTELAVLNFLWAKECADQRDYSTYSSDPALRNFTGRSQQQLNRALRRLEELSLLASTHQKPFRGTPILYHILFPKFGLVKELIGNKGRLLSLYILAYMRRTHNPLPSWKIARQFNISKRTAQRYLKPLKNGGLIRETKILRRRRKRNRKTIQKYVQYELTEGQKPITHWMKEK